MQGKFQPTYFNEIGVAIMFFYGKKAKIAKNFNLFGHISVMKNIFINFFILFLVLNDLLLLF